MADSWKIAAGADPAVWFYGSECVVHHALSNDTLRLTRSAGELLLSGMASGADAAAMPPAGAVVGTAEVEACLEALVGPGLVVRT